jgi:hypothetical protein
MSEMGEMGERDMTMRPEAMEPEARSDSELLAAVRRGDPDALAALHDRYREMALRFATSKLGTSSEAEDVVAAVFAGALGNGRGPVESFAPHLMSRVRDECHRLNRQRASDAELAAVAASTPAGGASRPPAFAPALLVTTGATSSGGGVATAGLMATHATPWSRVAPLAASSIALIVGIGPATAAWRDTAPASAALPSAAVTAPVGFRPDQPAVVAREDGPLERSSADTRSAVTAPSAPPEVGATASSLAPTLSPPAVPTTPVDTAGGGALAAPGSPSSARTAAPPPTTAAASDGGREPSGSLGSPTTAATVAPAPVAPVPAAPAPAAPPPTTATSPPAAPVPDGPPAPPPDAPVVTDPVAPSGPGRSTDAPGRNGERGPADPDGGNGDGPDD